MLEENSGEKLFNNGFSNVFLGYEKYRQQRNKTDKLDFL